MRIGAIIFGAAVTLAGTVAAQVTQPGGGLIRLDPMGPEFAGATGARPGPFSADGRFVKGHSTPSGGGHAPWLYDISTGTFTRLGFTDAAHTGHEGRQFSAPAFFRTDSTWMAGESLQYFGFTSQQGHSGWLYDSTSGQQIRLGFTGPRFTDTDGSSSTRISSGAAENGFVSGVSSAYEPGNSGRVAWVYDPIVRRTIEIGLTGAEFTAANGAVVNFAGGTPNIHGDVGGSVNRYLSGTPAGQAAWYYDHRAGTTTRIGFWDAAHTDSSGFQESSSMGSPSNSGVLAGLSQRYTPSSNTGTSAWVYRADTDTTTEIGLLDPAHMTADGTRFNRPEGGPTNSGFILGESAQVGITGPGQSLWLHSVNSGETSRIGLMDGDHARANGGSDNFLTTVGTINEAGFVAGQAVRYGLGGGLSAWVYSAAEGETRRVGLVDTQHTAASGRQESSLAVFPTEAGNMAGSSVRYSNDDTNGRTAWVYRYGTDTTVSFELSLGPDGSAHSEVLDVSDAFGVMAVGTYSEYSAEGEFVGASAFAWNPMRGVLDLNTAFADEAAEQGFARLTSADYVSDTGWVTGRGELLDGGEGAYLLFIPEPGVGLLAWVAVFAMAGRRRR